MYLPNNDQHGFSARGVHKTNVVNAATLACVATGNHNIKMMSIDKIRETRAEFEKLRRQISALCVIEQNAKKQKELSQLSFCLDNKISFLSEREFFIFIIKKKFPLSFSQALGGPPCVFGIPLGM